MYFHQLWWPQRGHPDSLRSRPRSRPTQHIVVDGNHIVIKVSDKVITDFVDEKNTFTKGYLALQQHDPKSVAYYKNLRDKNLK